MCVYERTYVECNFRSFLPVGEANSRKIWKSASSIRQIHTLGRGSHARKGDDRDVRSIAAESVTSDVIRNVGEGDLSIKFTADEWRGATIDVALATHQQVRSPTSLAALFEIFLLLPTSHLGDEKGSDESHKTQREFVVHPVVWCVEVVVVVFVVGRRSVVADVAVAFVVRSLLCARSRCGRSLSAAVCLSRRKT